MSSLRYKNYFFLLLLCNSSTEIDSRYFQTLLDNDPDHKHEHEHDHVIDHDCEDSCAPLKCFLPCLRSNVSSDLKVCCEQIDVEGM